MFLSLPNITVCVLLSTSVTLVKLIYNNKLYRFNYIYFQPLLKTEKSAEMWHVLNTSFFYVVGEAFFRIYVAYISYSCVELSAPYRLLIELFFITVV